MGYDYIAFDDHHFKEDLQYSDAVPMFHRLQALADREGLEFGLKLSNTFPVDVKAGELPSEEMYMAGKSLFPLTTTMAAMMAKEFGGKLRLSYAGGADAFNIDKDVYKRQPPPRAATAPSAWVSQLMGSWAFANSLRLEWSLLLEIRPHAVRII